LEKEVERER